MSDEDKEIAREGMLVKAVLVTALDGLCTRTGIDHVRALAHAVVLLGRACAIFGIPLVDALHAFEEGYCEQMHDVRGREKLN